jgi:hypothetical protein
MKKDGIVISESGIKSWYANGELHREDGPAVDYGDGAHAWYLNGKPHRVDGPAIYGFGDDAESWYSKGKLHREDGPAVIEDDIRQWYLYGVQLTEQQHADALGMCRKSKVKPL